ncbi:hypothetical protein [Bordetella genomosp. 10]|uniref:hypothetical protein n=1 Tax=Bordetella genomosp. 10 TaxID=1416804 RepID=UPI0011788A9F|nr:hypothetical protein [Bordetella genomosp. 10]
MNVIAAPTQRGVAMPRKFRGYERLVIFVLALLCLIATPAIGQVFTQPIHGLTGHGKQFRIQCQGGAWVNGITIHSGGWVDQLTAHCAAFPTGNLDEASFRLSRKVPDTAKAGGNGGSEEKTFTCPNDGYVSGIKYGFTRNGNQPQYLDYVEVKCSTLDDHPAITTSCLSAGDGCWDKHPTPGSYNGYGLSFTSNCSDRPPNSPPSFVVASGVVGFIGWEGSYVDSLGIVCGRLPDKPVKAGAGHNIK